jgi:phenylacetate-coenzyme A ligase PaaK-like adenylate-forming protein
MRIGYHRRRLADFAGGLRLARELAARERWPKERLRRHQQECLEAVVRHAVAHSPYYRQRLAGTVDEAPVELERLPTLDKAEMMERFDGLVTDPRLRRDSLLAWVEGLGRDELYLGRYRVMTTSGSSGRKGLFVYDEPGWRAIMAQFFRYNAMVGVRPRLPRRLRIAAIGGASPVHMTRQVSAISSIGVHRVLSLPVTLPLERLVEVLNRFQPEFMNVYPSVAMRLAEEQLAGRLHLSLANMSTSSEMRTPEMTERIVEAFGVRPFDFYGTTEGLWGCECEHHDGIHLFEDLVLVENVDEGGRPVPPGEPGARLLVTSLHNLVQPIIRLEIPDILTLDPEPCPCGRTLVRTRAIEGRSDDVLEIPTQDGGRVTVHPLQFAPVTRDRGVREFQVVQEGPRLRVLVVPRAGASGELEARLRDAVSRRLTGLGVEEPKVVVERRDKLPRSAGGKLQLVVADPAARTACPGPK